MKPGTLIARRGQKKLSRAGTAAVLIGLHEYRWFYGYGPRTVLSYEGGTVIERNNSNGKLFATRIKGHYRPYQTVRLHPQVVAAFAATQREKVRVRLCDVAVEGLWVVTSAGKGKVQQTVMRRVDFLDRPTYPEAWDDLMGLYDPRTGGWEWDGAGEPVTDIGKKVRFIAVIGDFERFKKAMAGAGADDELPS